MNEASSGSYPYEIMCVKKELQKFSETYWFDRKKRLYELLKLPYDERQGIACQKYGGLAEMTLRIPARVFVYLLQRYKALISGQNGMKCMESFMWMKLLKTMLVSRS